MKNKFLYIMLIMILPLSSSVQAVIEFDQNITPDIIFGAGNTNGQFTTDRDNGIEVGIRAKIPFVGTVNSNGDGTYSYDLGDTWNFDWTINTDFDGSTGLNLDQFTYELGLDANPGLGVNYLVFDSVTPTMATPFFDHSIGDNTTANGAGVEATDGPSYLALLAANNVLQQSWRYAFFPVPPLDTYDPNVAGTYAVYLLVRDGSGTVIARSNIQVLIGGAPPVLPAVAVPLFNDVGLMLALFMLVLFGFTGLKNTQYHKY
jgi:hypothetical protein